MVCPDCGAPLTDVADETLACNGCGWEGTTEEAEDSARATATFDAEALWGPER